MPDTLKPIARLCLSALLAASTAHAMAEGDIIGKSLALRLPDYSFRAAAHSSPALRAYMDAPAMSEITLLGRSAPSATAKIPQLGNGGRMFGLEAGTFQRITGNDALWGMATYKNGRKYDVVWNETSDFADLYPYVMADGRGGDLKYEQYELEGGYSMHHNKTCYGVEVGYRALSEYRDRDPRPNNTVADLHARLGFGYAFGHFGTLALTANAGKYKQTNELAYFNELGAQKEFHLTGIGNDFARFSGASNNTFYKGYSYGASLDFIQRGGRGLSASVSYLFTKKEKTLTDLNRLTLNEIRINKVGGGVAWLKEAYGIRAQGCYASRKGKDNLFGDPTGSVYPQIGSQEQYDGSESFAKIDGYWQSEAQRKWLWGIEPMVCYAAMHSRHNSSGNELNTDDIVFGLTGKGFWHKGKSLVGAKAGVYRRTNISAEFTLNKVADESLGRALEHVNEYFGQGETSINLGLSYDRAIFGNKAVSAELTWRHDFYLETENNEYELRISFKI